LFFRPSSFFLSFCLPIRLIAIDIDGTLLDSHGTIPPENAAALARASAAGAEIVLATGRRFDFARPIFEQLVPCLDAELTLILSNGAVVKRHDGETLVRHLLSREIARGVLAAVPEHRATAAVLFDRVREGQIVYEAIDWAHPLHGRFFEMNRPFLAEVSPLEDALTEDPLQVMFTGGCADMRRLFDRLREIDGAPYAVALTEYAFRDFSLVDVIKAGCSKGAALSEWAARRGIAAHDVMAIGDNLNDLQMLEFAGHPVLMGNAVPELKTRGWPVTASNDAAGVARAIEERLSWHSA
jgi:Cof subfamily protein (haloacid dehalogenase superfamily)